MDKIRLPRLYCPFPSRINTNVASLRESHISWIRKFELVPDEGEFQKFCASRFHSLVARAYPDSPMDKLAIACDWVSWMFILDDIAEIILKEPEAEALLYEDFLRILSDQTLRGKMNRMGRALDDIHRRLKPVASKEWRERFVSRVQECLQSWVWENGNRQRKEVPALESYIKIRPHSGALYTVIELIQITDNIALPPKIRSHDIVQHLVMITNNVVNYANDIVSLERELKRGDVHNLALALKEEHGLSLQEAVNRTAKIFDNEVRAFIDLKRLLPSFGPENDLKLKAFLSILSSMMRGHLEWLYETGRYRPEGGTSVSQESLVSQS